MEHFDIVLGLARAALDSRDHRRVAHFVAQLRDAVAQDDAAQAAKLGRLLTAASKKQDMVPLDLSEMLHVGQAARRRLSGELLTRNTPLPRDRESGAPLVRIIFPDDPAGDAPVFPADLMAAVNDVLGEWSKLDRLAELQAAPHLRCLLYGAPGVGKTQLAHHVARHLDLPCVEARLDGLVSSFLGTTARNIAALFEFADRYRCLLFLDEFDALAKARDDIHELGEIKRVVNTLLQCLDAREGHGFTIAATNHEHLLDAAVWRRFDARIEVPKPDAQAREKIIERHVRPLELEPVGKALLRWMADGLTGADIAGLGAAMKRYHAVHGERNAGPRMASEEMLAALRRHVVLNSKLFSAERLAALTGSREDLDRALTAAGLNQSERACLLGVSQSTISRTGRPRKKKAVKGGEDG